MRPLSWLVLIALCANTAVNAAEVQIASGEDHTLMLDANGQVWAWGANSEGQLGNGSTTASTTVPVQVTAADTSVLSTVIAVAAFGEPSSGSFSLALKVDGTVWAWGDNTYGQLGDNTSGTDRTRAVQVFKDTGASLNNVIAISCGRRNGYALVGDGTVWAWGDNSMGQLGDGTTTGPIDGAVQVGVITNIIGIAGGGNHALALRGDGTVWAWGENSSGECGNNTAIGPKTSPVQVRRSAILFLTNVISISAGYQASMALTADGQVWTWGDNLYGQIGDGTTGGNRQVATSVLSFIKSISCGQWGHKFALQYTGTGYGWGFNGDGRMGYSVSTSDQLSPVQVSTPGGTPIRTMSAGRRVSSFLMATGEVYGAGSGFGSTPTLVSAKWPMSGMQTVSAGRNHTLGLKADGTVWAWGSNSYGQLGDGTLSQSLVPVQVLASAGVPLTNIVAITCGADHSMALTADGRALCWGANYSGQLGDGSTNASSYPVSVYSAARGIGAGRASSYAIVYQGWLAGWGYNGSYELSLGHGTSSVLTYEYSNQSAGTRRDQVKSVEGGWIHALMVLADGTARGMGSNGQGQYGDGTYGSTAYAAQTPSLTMIKAAAAGQNHSHFLLANGTSWSAGYNGFSQLGDGGTTASTSPVQYFPGTAKSVSAGSDYGDTGLTLRSDGRLVGWGKNDAGQAGSGTIGTSVATLAFVRLTLPSGSLETQMSNCSIHDSHGVAVTGTGLVRGWGSNGFGQLGNNTTIGSVDVGAATYAASSTWLPTVTVAATDSSANEAGTDSATFTITRTGSTVGMLTVNYTMSGTAVSGTDYTTVTGSVIIPAGSASAVVTITPIDDSIDENQEGVTLTLSASALAYQLGSPSANSATLDDNDTAGITLSATSGRVTTESLGTDSFTVVLNTQPTATVTISLSSSNTSEGTVSPGSLFFGAAATGTGSGLDGGNLRLWSNPATVTLTGVNDSPPVVDGNIAYTILTGAAVSGDTKYNGIDPSDVSATNNDNDTAGFTFSTISGSQVIEVAKNFTSTTTVATVVNFAGGTDLSLARVGMRIRCTSATANAGLNRVITAVNDAADNITVGVALTSTGAAETWVFGEGGTVNVRLATVPSAAVTLTLSVSDSTEGNISTTTLSFNSTDWNTDHPVSVSSVNDDVDDGDITWSIVTAAATSGDPNYNGVDPSNISITTVDDDVAGVTISESSGSTAVVEGGATDTYTVVLNTQPTATVTVTITPNAQVTASAATLSFTTSNWNTPQSVTVTAVNDSVAEGTHNGSIAHAAAGGGYAAVTIASVTPSITDNDNPGFTFSATSGLVTTEVLGSASFTVRLASQPTASVSFTLTSSNLNEGTVSTASVFFGAAAIGTGSGLDVANLRLWSNPLTVTVTGVNDLIDDGDVAYSIVTAVATSADSFYNVLNPSDVSVTNTDNDTAGATIVQTGGTTAVTEGGATDTYTIALNSEPTATVTLTLSGTQVTPSSTTLFFAAAALGSGDGSTAPNARLWSNPASLTVTAVNDSVAEGAHSGTITHSAANGGYTAVTLPSLTVSVTDNDTAGFTSSGISGNTTEAGGTATCTIALNTQPTASVQIGISSSNTGEGTVSTAGIFFGAAATGSGSGADASNLRLWSNAATITVTGVNDTPPVDDGDIAYSVITASVVSADNFYSGLNPIDISVTNTDNDTAAVTITESGGTTVITESGTTDSYTVVLTTQPTSTVTVTPSPNAQVTVSPTTLSFTTATWNVAQTVTVTAVDDPDIEGAHAGAIAHAASGGGYGAVVIASVAPSITDNDTAGITVTPIAGLVTSESGGTATFTMVLTSRPTASVRVDLSSSDLTEGTVSQSAIYFGNAASGDGSGSSAGNLRLWSSAGTITVTGVDDLITDNTIAYSIVTAAAVSGDGNYSLLNASNVAVDNQDNDVPGVTILPLSGLTTSESGGVALFSVKLNTQPDADVSFALVSSNTAEGTVSAASLTFTNANWSSFQTVTITGVDDSIDDGNISFTIQTGVVSAPGETTGYNTGSLNPADVTVTNLDNDTASVTLAVSGGTTVITEAGATDTYTVTLGTRPTGVVAVSVAADSQATVNKSTIYFSAAGAGALDGTTALNALAWNSLATVTITAVNDSVAESIHPAVISHSINVVNTVAAEFIGLAVSSVSAVVIDNDTAGFTVSAISGNTTEAGVTATCTVVLTSQPTADVTVAVTSSNTAEGTVSPASLVFTVANWNVAQTVTASGVNDDVADGTKAYIIQLAAAVSADTTYNAIDPSDVSVSNSDNDTIGVTIGGTGGSTDVAETGATDSYTLVLNSEPTATVTITITPDAEVEADTDLGTAGFQHTLTFTTANWNVAQTVTVSALDDSVAEGAHTGAIAHSAAAGGYTGVTIASVTANITDNDTAGVTVGALSGSVSEAGTTATYTLVLTSRPTATVTVSLTPNAQLTTSTSTAYFGTAASGSGDGLSAVNARLWSNPLTVTVTAVNDSVAEGGHTGTVSHAATGGGYNAVVISSVTATIVDNDTAGVSVLPTSGLSVTEVGGTAAFQVVLSSQPTATVTIALSSTDTTEGTVSPALLTFTTASWNLPQQVTITGADDAIDDGNLVLSITTGDAVSADTAYSGQNVADVAVTCIDDDAAGVTLSTSAIVVTEAGVTSSYTVVLTSQPTVDVTVGLNPDGQVSTSLSTVYFGAAATGSGLGTNASNLRLWSNAVTVTVTAINDDVAEGGHSGTISHSAAGGEYGSVTIASVTATITDNDTAGFVVGAIVGSPRELGGGIYSFATVSVTAATRTIQFAASTDLSTAFVGQTVKFTTDDGGVSGINLATVGTIVTIDDGNDRITIAESIVDSATAERLTFYAGARIRLSSQPTSVVVISLATSDSTEGDVTPPNMTFTSANWNQDQVVTAVGQDDDVDDGNVAWTIQTGAAFSPDTLYNSLNPADVALSTLDDDAAGLAVTFTSPASRLTTTEAGGTTTFTVRLTSQPTAAVTVAVASSAITQGTVSPATLTFTTANWETDQTVTVTGADTNATDDGNVNYTATTTPSSVDANYNVGALAQTTYLTNLSVNNTPVLDAITAVTLAEDFGTSPVTLTGIGSGQTGEAQVLTVTASSSNTSLVTVGPASQVAAGATATLTLTSVLNATGTATITVTVQDNGGTANSAVDFFTRTFLVTITAVNDAPVITVVGGGNTFVEGAGAVTILGSGSLTVADVDNNSQSSASVTITNLLDGSAELLSATTAGTSISASYNSSTGILSLSAIGAQPITDWQSVLRSITYANSSANPSLANRTIAFVINDGTVDSTTVNQTVVVQAVNGAPVLDLDATSIGTGYAAAWSEGGGPVAIVDEFSLAISDSDNANLAGATAQLAAIPDGAFEILTVDTTGTAITAAYAVDTLTLSGADTLANYQMVLRTLTYDNLDDDPSAAARTVTVTINDGAATTSATATIAMTAANDAPVLDLNGPAAGTGYAATYTEDNPAVAAVGAAALTVSDSDNANLASATARIDAGVPPDGTAEILAVDTSGTAITAVYAGGVLQLTTIIAQPIADFQQVLRTLTYINTSQDPTIGARAVTVLVNDGTASSALVTSTVTVVAANDAPAVDLNGAGAGVDMVTPAGFTEGSPAQQVHIAGVSVTDPDSIQLTGGTITLQNPLDAAAETLAVTTTGLGITAIWNPATWTMTLSGTADVANYQQLLSSLTYINSSDTPNITANRTIAVVLSDGSASSPTATGLVQVTAVNDAPALAVSGNFTVGPYTIPLGSTLNVRAADDLNAATDELILAASDNDDALASLVLTVSLPPNLGDLKLSGVPLPIGGTFTVADLVAGNLVYEHRGTLAGGDGFAIQVEDGNGGSSVAIITLTINGLVPPQVTINNTTAAAWAEVAGLVQTPIQVDGTAIVTDTDSVNFLGGSITVSVAGGRTGDLIDFDSTLVGGALLRSGANLLQGATVVGTMSGGADGNSLVVGLTIACTPGLAQTILRGMTWTNTGKNPGVDPDVIENRTLTIIINDGSTNSVGQIRTINVDPYDDPPVLTAYTVALTPGLTVTGQLVATDPEGELLSFSLGVPLASNGLVTLAGAGSFSYEHQIFNGLTDSFGVVVTEAGPGQAASGTVQVVVTEQGATAPQITSVAPARAEAGVLFTYTPVLAGFGASPDLEYVLLPTLAEAVSGTLLSDPADYTFSGGRAALGATGTLRIPLPAAPADLGEYIRTGILVIDRVTNRSAYQPILIKINPGFSG